MGPRVCPRRLSPWPPASPALGSLPEGAPSEMHLERCSPCHRPRRSAPSSEGCLLSHGSAVCQPGVHWGLLCLLFGNPEKIVKRAKRRFFQSPRSTQTSRKKRCVLNSYLGMHSLGLLPCQAQPN